jgi:hypothetical protein
MKEKTKTRIESNVVFPRFSLYIGIYVCTVFFGRRFPVGQPVLAFLLIEEAPTTVRSGPRLVVQCKRVQSNNLNGAIRQNNDQCPTPIKKGAVVQRS